MSICFIKKSKERGETMIYQKVVDFCKEKNIPVYIFEKECGLGNGTIKNWKSASPRIDSVQKVAKRMGVAIETLLSEETPQQVSGR